MASGDIVGIIGHVVQPAATYAAFDTRPGGSTPAEAVPVYDFDDTTEEYIDIPCRLEGYDGGGLTLTFDWSATAATSGDARWRAAIRRIADDAEDVDTAHTYDFNEVNDTAASVSGERSRVSIPFTDGADMDSLADGEDFILRIARESGDAGDTMVGDAELWADSIVIKET